MEALIFLALLVLGLLIGGTRERLHFRNLERRERARREMVVSQMRCFPERADRPGAELFVAEVVIGTDYLKTFLAKLRNLFGGQVGSFQTLMIRARREALLRIMEQAHERGYNALCNVRLETADVGGNAAERKVPMAAIVASGTAYHAEKRSSTTASVADG